MCQFNSRKCKDWATTIINDLKELNINLNLEEISEMSKQKFKKIVKMATMKHALEYLHNMKSEQSKVKHLEYCELKMVDYLASNNLEI